MEQHRHTRGITEYYLRLIKTIAVPNLYSWSPARIGRIALQIVRGHDNAPHPFSFEGSGEGWNRHGTINLLTTSHAHRTVVEDLEGDVALCRHSLTNGQGARVEEGTITKILEHVGHGAEGGNPNPLCALATHVTESDRIPPHAVNQSVAADPTASHRAFGYDR